MERDLCCLKKLYKGRLNDENIGLCNYRLQYLIISFQQTLKTITKIYSLCNYRIIKKRIRIKNIQSVLKINDIGNTQKRNIQKFYIMMLEMATL